MLLRFLSANYPLEKHLFFVTRYAYGLVSLHMEQPQTLLSLAWLAFNFINLAHCCYAEFVFGLHYLFISPVDAMDAFCPLACSLTTLFKMLCMWANRKRVAHLIQRIRLLTEQQNSRECIKLKRWYYSIATRSGMLVFTLGTITTCAFVSRSLWEISVNLNSDMPFKYEMPFRMLFPNMFHRMPLYPLAYLYSTWSGQVTVYGFAGTDAFFFGFTLYATFLLKALQLDIEQVLRVENAPNSFNANICARQLSGIIDRHSEIFEIVEEFSDIMALPTLIHFVSASLVIATSVIDILLYSGYNIIRYVVYTCTVNWAIFLYCFGGTSMMTASYEVGEVAYSSGWYHWNRNVKKMIYLCMLRAQRPLIVRVPFFAPTLPLFTSVIKFTGSIVALAKTII